MQNVVEYGGGLHAEVRFYFRYTWQLCLASGSLGHLEITLTSGPPVRSFDLFVALLVFMKGACLIRKNSR